MEYPRVPPDVATLTNHRGVRHGVRFVSIVAVAAIASSAISMVAANPVLAAQNGSVLDQNTDVAVTMSVPTTSSRGSTLAATLLISNLGRSTAQRITCVIAVPRVDAVSGFTVDYPSTKKFDPVEGTDYREVSMEALQPGEVRSVKLTGSALLVSDVREFLVGALCFPEPVDHEHSNNYSSVKVRMV
jgi:hypothetical protein